MATKVRWGVLGVANIAMMKVIPGMQRGQYTEIAAIASRDPEKARAAAAKLEISKAYGSYEDLLADPDIDAIYNPLPNHLHVPWSIKALEAGKHVLCEKPIGLSSAEARQLIEARDKAGRKAGEAFMASSHPQWSRAREIVRSGAIGELCAVTGFFSYYNRKPENVRNIAAWGGGALMDIGCYPLNLTRMIFGEDPRRVTGVVERDPDFKTDRLTTVLLDFPSGQASFTISTQLVPYQRMQILGTRGRIELDIPFNALPDRPMHLLIDDGSSLLGAGIRVEEVAVCDQYTIQGNLFSRAILDDGPVAVPIEEALQTMRVIEAILRSAETGCWEAL